MPVINDPLQERSVKKADYLDEVVFALGGYVSPEELAVAIEGFEIEETPAVIANQLLNRRVETPMRRIVDFRHLHQRLMTQANRAA